jgi:3-hydroxybutyryl-CoA dehydratase
MKSEARNLKIGDALTAQRTFTADDVIAFGRVSGDRGRHHLVLDAKGRLMVHGLHTATLATEIGGSIDFVAREMVFDFQRPVFAGDTVTCTCTVMSLTQEEGRRAIEVKIACVNQHGKDVLLGRTSGVVLEEA